MLENRSKAVSLSRETKPKRDFGLKPVSIPAKKSPVLSDSKMRQFLGDANAESIEVYDEENEQEQ
jgi:hypothetical protein